MAKRKKKKKCMTERNLDYLRRHYSDMPNTEIAEKLGFSSQAVGYWGLKLGLKKSEDCLRGIIERRAERVRQWNESLTDEQRAELRRKRSEAAKRQIRMERARILFGLETKTKRKVTSEPPQKRSCRHRLKKAGYIVLSSRHEVYYTVATVRDPQKEATAAKWGIKVLPLPSPPLPDETDEEADYSEDNELTEVEEPEYEEAGELW